MNDLTELPTCCICSFVKLARSSPSSCKYIQSFFGQLWFFMKCEQYFVVPREALRVRPSKRQKVILFPREECRTTYEYVVDRLDRSQSIFRLEVGDVRTSTWPLSSSLNTCSISTSSSSTMSSSPLSKGKLTCNWLPAYWVLWFITTLWIFPNFPK